MLWTLRADQGLPCPLVCPPEPLMAPACVKHALSTTAVQAVCKLA